MKIELGFKRESEALLRKRFRELTHPVIRAVIWDTAFYLWVNYATTICLTCLWRSPEENKADGGKPTSRHLEIPSRAVDIRTKDWPHGALESVQDYLSTAWGDNLYVLYEKDKIHLHIHLSRTKFPNPKDK